jgi:hypothetical protein
VLKEKYFINTWNNWLVQWPYLTTEKILLLPLWSEFDPEIERFLLRLLTCLNEQEIAIMTAIKKIKPNMQKAIASLLDDMHNTSELTKE